MYYNCKSYYSNINWIFLTLKKKMNADNDHVIFLDSDKEHCLSQYSCICVRTLQDMHGKSNVKYKKAVLSGSKGSGSGLVLCLGPSNEWSTAQSCPERLYSLCVWKSSRLNWIKPSRIWSDFTAGSAWVRDWTPWSHNLNYPMTGDMILWPIHYDYASLFRDNIETCTLAFKKCPASLHFLYTGRQALKILSNFH